MSGYKTGDFEFGLAIYPSFEVRKKAFEIINAIETQVPLVFRLDETHLPHITLFQGVFPQNAKEKIIEVTEKYFSDLKSKINIEMFPELFFHPIGNIFWNTQKFSELLDLHLDCLEFLRPLTEGALMQQWIERLQNAQTDLNEKQKEVVEKNGFAESGELFLPHITLGRLVKKSDAVKLQNIFVPAEKFTVYEIIGGPLGAVGNIEEIWFSYKV